MATLQKYTNLEPSVLFRNAPVRRKGRKATHIIVRTELNEKRPITLLGISAVRDEIPLISATPMSLPTNPATRVNAKEQRIAVQHRLAHSTVLTVLTVTK